MNTRQLSDARVGNAKSELIAQRDHSEAVLRFFHSHHWMRATRHSSCLSVPWEKTCLRARAQVKAHRWLFNVAVERYERLYGVAAWLRSAFMCIHGGEGAWDSATGNGYFGGLQMDTDFMRSYGWNYGLTGTADKWSPTTQIQVAVRAYSSGRGFTPWPNTARACGLL